MATTFNISRAFHAADSFYEFVAAYPDLDELYENREFVAQLTGESVTDVRIAICDNNEERERAALEYVEEQASEAQPVNEFTQETLAFLDIESAEAYAEQVAEKFGCISIDRQAVTDILYESGLLLFQFFGQFRTYHRFSEARRTYAKTQDIFKTIRLHYYGKEDSESLGCLEIFGIDENDVIEALQEAHEIRREAVYSELEALLKNGADFDEVYADVCSACDFIADSNDEDYAKEHFNIN